MSNLQKPSFFVSPSDARKASEAGIVQQKLVWKQQQEKDEEQKKVDREKLLQDTFNSMELIFTKIKELSDNGTSRYAVKEFNPSALEREVLIKVGYHFKWIDCDFNDSGIARDSNEYLIW